MVQIAFFQKLCKFFGRLLIITNSSTIPFYLPIELNTAPKKIKRFVQRTIKSYVIFGKSKWFSIEV